MPLTPGHGETALPKDELEALLPNVRSLRDGLASKAAIHDIEQALDELLSDHFLRRLYTQLYGEIWRWAGLFRTRELGIAAHAEAVRTTRSRTARPSCPAPRRPRGL